MVPVLKGICCIFQAPTRLFPGPDVDPLPSPQSDKLPLRRPISSAPPRRPVSTRSVIIVLWSVCLNRFVFQTTSGLRLSEGALTFLVFPEAASTNTHLQWETPSTLSPFLHRWLDHRFLNHWIQPHHGEVGWFILFWTTSFRFPDLCWSHQCTSKARNPSLPPCWLQPHSWIRNSFSVQLASFQPYALER